MRSAVLTAAFCLWSATASADWLLTPFFGTAFAGETTLGDLDRGAGQTKLTVGGAFAIVGDGLFGVEGDFGYSPGFFQGDDPAGLVVNSRVTTVTGSVLFTVPLSFTRESLRPYGAAGLGLLAARSEDVLGLVTINRNLIALQVGGGATGFVSDNTGLRFDLRYIRALGREDGPFARTGVARLAFWRLTAGVVFRIRG